MNSPVDFTSTTKVESGVLCSDPVTVVVLPSTTADVSVGKFW